MFDMNMFCWQSFTIAKTFKYILYKHDIINFRIQRVRH